MFTKKEETGTIGGEVMSLGLFICKHIVENSGGFISVTSDGINKGTTFWFSMKMTVPLVDMLPVESTCGQSQIEVNMVQNSKYQSVFDALNRSTFENRNRMDSHRLKAYYANNSQVVQNQT